MAGTGASSYAEIDGSGAYSYAFGSNIVSDDPNNVLSNEGSSYTAA